ncbi:MAG: hypothetical protein HC796_00320 [Synechococcaceae cyanobacterium RL_1_2]|nr:hypothetical protein [Synechococcaceae cyanobacterium RL_1_2]
MAKLHNYALGRSPLPFVILTMGLAIAFGFVTPAAGNPLNPNPQSLPSGIGGTGQEGQIYVVTGTVEALTYLLSQGAYQLKDNTGSVWIVTPGKMPRIGDRLSVRAKLMYRSIVVQGQEFGEYYLMEMEQLPVQANNNPNPLPPKLPTPETVTPETVVIPPQPSISVDDFLYPHW